MSAMPTSCVALAARGGAPAARDRGLAHPHSTHSRTRTHHHQVWGQVRARDPHPRAGGAGGAVQGCARGPRVPGPWGATHTAGAPHAHARGAWPHGSSTEAASHRDGCAHMAAPLHIVGAAACMPARMLTCADAGMHAHNTCMCGRQCINCTDLCAHAHPHNPPRRCWTRT